MPPNFVSGKVRIDLHKEIFMAHMTLAHPLPGIAGLLVTRTDTAGPLTDLAEMLLRRSSPTFSSAERELVAAYVSYLNNCVFCSESHAGAANAHAKEPQWAQHVWSNMEKNAPSEKMRALLRIAAKVQSTDFKVGADMVASARAQGATDNDVHDTVLIAAAFCMYNRYVDGMGTTCPPRGDESYREMGSALAHEGYKRERV
jgi:uncharacterized peroxidase-related enzyme